MRVFIENIFMYNTINFIFIITPPQITFFTPVSEAKNVCTLYLLYRVVFWLINVYSFIQYSSSEPECTLEKLCIYCVNTTSLGARLILTFRAFHTAGVSCDLRCEGGERGWGVIMLLVLNVDTHHHHHPTHLFMARGAR